MAVPMAYGNIQMQSVLDLMGENDLLGEDNNQNLVVSFVEEDVFNYAVKDLIEFDSNIPVGDFEFGIDGVTIDFDFAYSITLGDLLEDLTGDIEEIKELDGEEGKFPAYTYMPDTPLDFDLDAVDDFQSVTFAGGQLKVELTNNLPVFGVYLHAELFDIANNRKITDLNFGEAGVYPGYEDFTQVNFRGFPFGLPGKICDTQGAPGAATESVTVDLTDLTLSNELGVKMSYFMTNGSGGLKPLISFTDGMDFKISLANAEVKTGNFKVPEQKIEGELAKIEGIKISDDIDLHKATLNSGELNITMNKTLPITGDIELIFPSITKNGQTVSSNITFAEKDSYNFTIDLANAVIDFSENDENIFNTLFYSYNVVINPSSGYIEFGANESFAFDIEISNLDIKSADGNFGQMEVILDEEEMSLSLDFFDMLEGDMKFLNPTMKFIIENSLSVPVEVALDLVGYNTEGQFADLGREPFIIPYPNYPVETSVTGEVVTDKDNSNIVEFLALPPTDRITLGGKIKMNPDGAPTTKEELNHVEMDGSIAFDLAIDIPFEIETSGIQFTDTIAFDGTLLDVIGAGAALLINAKNGLPLGVDIELVFMDSISGEEFGQSVQTVLLDAAQVDDNGDIIASSSSNNEIALTAENIPFYQNANAIKFTANIASPEDGTKPAKIKTTNEIYLSVGLKAGIDLSNLNNE